MARGGRLQKVQGGQKCPKMVLKKQNRYARVRLPSKAAYELSNGQILPVVELWELVFSKLHIYVYNTA